VRSRLTLTVLAAASALALLFAGAAAAEAPQINTAASISGTAAVGQQLTAHNGTWLYADGSSCQSECTMSYQWQRCAGGCADISGASGRFYTVQAADAGHTLRVMERVAKYDCGEWNYSNMTQECRDIERFAPSGHTAVVPGSAPGNPTGPTAPAAPVIPSVPAPQAPLAPTPTAAPTVAGLAMVEEVLTATPGTWSGSPALTLEWQRCDEAGQNCVGLGVTSPTYQVIPVDVGKTLRVKVTGANLAAARDALSDATQVVSELKPTEQKPTIEASKVLAPHKLVIENVGAKPAKLARRGTVVVRLTVADTRGFKVSGALVTVVARPVGAFLLPAAATSAADGTVVLTFKPGPKLDVTKLKTVTLVVTARRPGDRVTSPRASIARVTLAVAKAKKTARR
jgi:hypothetical protein